MLAPPSVATRETTAGSGHPRSASGARGGSSATARSCRSFTTKSKACSTARSAAASRFAFEASGHGGARQHALLAELAPDALAHVRQHGMSEPERRAEHVQQRLRDLALGRRIVAVEARLGGLEVPVADVVPDEAVERLDGGGEVVGVERGGHLGDGVGELPEHPGVDRLGARGRRLGLRIDVEQDHARRVPELVAEPAALLDRALGEAHVLRRAHLEQAVARRVGAVPRDQVERIDARAERLRHAPAVGREHGRVDDDVPERLVAR